MSDTFKDIYSQICADPMNAEMLDKGYVPLYTAAAGAKIVVVGQAPGLRAQTSMKPWDDASGVKLREWMGVTEGQFYDPNLVALLPMDFFFPGKARHGDLPPRKGFAEKWHSLLLARMPNVELILVIGGYAQKYYLGSSMKANLTETVRAFDEYLPKYFPLVHPSPLNFRWQGKNPWFAERVVPVLRVEVEKALG